MLGREANLGAVGLLADWREHGIGSRTELDGSGDVRVRCGPAARTVVEAREHHEINDDAKVRTLRLGAVFLCPFLTFGVVFVWFTIRCSAQGD